MSQKTKLRYIGIPKEMFDFLEESFKNPLVRRELGFLTVPEAFRDLARHLISRIDKILEKSHSSNS